MSWFSRLKQGLSKTRQKLGGGLANVVLGKKQLDDELLETIETILLTADVGFNTTEFLLEQTKKQLTRQALKDSDAFIQALKQQMVALLKPCQQTLEINHHPFVILMTGINGAGKTTSIAKIAHYYQQQNHSLLLAAGDTFRAAAVEQLKVWGERNRVPVIAQQANADSASVIYDALDASVARKIDIVLADTAGRLHTQDHLMAELAKIKRVMSKKIPGAPHETLLVIDATLGQNALLQVKAFQQTVDVTGLVITKLDGSAKAGVVLSIAKELALPIRFIGVGEGIDDLQPFDAEEFTDALFS